MKHSLLWIALCSIAICDVRGGRDRLDDRNNNVQSQNSDDLDNGKLGTQPYTKPLHHKMTNIGNSRNNSQVPPISTQDRIQPPSSDSDLLIHARESEGKLAMDFMAEAIVLTQGEDFVLSPFGIWGIAAMVFSAAEKDTAKELSKLLRTDRTSSRIEAAYRAAYNAINSVSDSVESTVLNLAAMNKLESHNENFLRLYQSVFKTQLFPVDTSNKQSAANTINRWAASTTRQRITNVVEAGDFDGLKVLLASATYFKGRWQQPFNETATAPDAFKDENDAIVVSGVAMMRMRGILKYGYSTKLDCQILELPYADGQTSMIVFLPKRKMKLKTVLEGMRGSSLADLLPPEMSEEEVDVSLPRFSTQFHANLNTVFVNLNAGRMHHPDAELPRLANNTYISKITHIAEIETTEEGTVASSVTSALVSYKTSATSFQANRPFIYFINHMPSRLVLFSGKISKPSPT